MPKPLADRTRRLKNSDIRRWTNLITERGAANFAQGVCFVEVSPETNRAIEQAYAAMQTGRSEPGYNTYSHYSGVRELREAIADKVRMVNGIQADPHPEKGNIVVTAAATGGFAGAAFALTDPGDEVVVFEPCYTYHTNILALSGAIPRYVRLRQPNWTFDLAELEAVCKRPRAKAILVNTPNNPTGKVFSRAELDTIASVCQRYDLYAITDEVYEFMVYDGLEHISLASLPGMAERTVTVTSFSKTLAITGWRVGYAVAPAAVAREIGKVNEYLYVCAPTPAQHAIATLVRDVRPFRELSPFYQRKRDILCDALERVGFSICRPAGAYYVLADFTALGYPDDVTANTRLIEEVGVGAVPAGDFYTDDTGRSQLRFCFAVRDEVLVEGVRRLERYGLRKSDGKTGALKSAAHL